MRAFELIVLHAVIFAGLVVALTLVGVVRVLFGWLAWNWGRFRRETRRAARSLGLVAALGQATIVLAESPVADSRAWPAFRGVGTSVTSAAELPLEWNDTSGIRWTAELPGYGQSSPVVWGERIFVTAMQGDNKETATVVCLALDSGEPMWQRESAASQTAPVSNYVSRAAPTPAVDGQRVYAFFESGDLLALDHDGNPVWSRSLVKEYGTIEGQHGIGSSLALTDESLIVLVNHGGPSYLMAVDKQTGDVCWKIDYEPRVAWSSPAICRAGGREWILTSAAGAVEAYDARDGQRLWRIGELSGNTVVSPTVHEGTIVIGSTDKSSNVAIELSDGARSEPPAVLWKADGPSCSFASPLIHRGHVYYVNAAGVAFCANLDTGRVVWKQRLGDSCWASPMGAGQRVYFFTKGGTTVVVRAGPEWEELATNRLELSPGAKLYGTAAFDGAILLRTGNRLICAGSP